MAHKSHTLNSLYFAISPGIISLTKWFLLQCGSLCWRTQSMYLPCPPVITRQLPHSKESHFLPLGHPFHIVEPSNLPLSANLLSSSGRIASGLLLWYQHWGCYGIYCTHSITFYLWPGHWQFQLRYGTWLKRDLRGKDVLCWLRSDVLFLVEKLGK